MTSCTHLRCRPTPSCTQRCSEMKRWWWVPLSWKMFALHRLQCRPEFCNTMTVRVKMLQLPRGSYTLLSKSEWNYVIRCREQSQKSTSMARSCLDSSVSLFRHSMKSLRPPWGPSSQMKAQSLGKRSSRCVRPAVKKKGRMNSYITPGCFKNTGCVIFKRGSFWYWPVSIWSRICVNVDSAVW